MEEVSHRSLETAVQHFQPCKIRLEAIGFQGVRDGDVERGCVLKQMAACCRGVERSAGCQQFQSLSGTRDGARVGRVRRGKKVPSSSVRKEINCGRQGVHSKSLAGIEDHSDRHRTTCHLQQSARSVT